MPINNEILDTIWSWIIENGNQFFALIGKKESGIALGFMHCREMPSPLREAVVGFLDDPYVSSDARGTGREQALYEASNQFGKTKDGALSDG